MQNYDVLNDNKGIGYLQYTLLKHRCTRNTKSTWYLDMSSYTKRRRILNVASPIYSRTAGLEVRLRQEGISASHWIHRWASIGGHSYFTTTTYFISLALSDTGMTSRKLRYVRLNAMRNLLASYGKWRLHACERPSRMCTKGAVRKVTTFPTIPRKWPIGFLSCHNGHPETISKGAKHLPVRTGHERSLEKVKESRTDV